MKLIGEGTYNMVYVSDSDGSVIYKIHKTPISPSYSSIPNFSLKEFLVPQYLNYEIESQFKKTGESYTLSTKTKRYDTDLHKFVISTEQSDRDLLVKNVRFIVNQIVENLLYFEKINLIHGDLKLSNILINKKTLEIKIIDFGVSMLNVGMCHRNDTIMFTDRYNPPEKFYSSVSVVYVFGCMLYELLMNVSIKFSNGKLIYRTFKDSIYYALDTDSQDLFRKIIDLSIRPIQSRTSFKKIKELLGYETVTILPHTNTVYDYPSVINVGVLKYRKIFIWNLPWKTKTHLLMTMGLFDNYHSKVGGCLHPKSSIVACIFIVNSIIDEDQPTEDACNYYSVKHIPDKQIEILEMVGYNLLYPNEFSESVATENINEIKIKLENKFT